MCHLTMSDTQLAKWECMRHYFWAQHDQNKPGYRRWAEISMQDAHRWFYAINKHHKDVGGMNRYYTNRQLGHRRRSLILKLWERDRHKIVAEALKGDTNAQKLCQAIQQLKNKED